MNLINYNHLETVLTKYQPMFLTLDKTYDVCFLGKITEDFFSELLSSSGIDNKLHKTENKSYTDMVVRAEGLIQPTQIKFRKKDPSSYTDFKLHRISLPSVSFDELNHQNLKFIFLKYILNHNFFILYSKNFKKFFIHQLSLQVKNLTSNVIKFDENVKGKLTGNFDGEVILNNEFIAYIIDDVEIWRVDINKGNKRNFLLNFNSTHHYKSMIEINNDELLNEDILTLDNVDFNSYLKGEILENKVVNEINKLSGFDNATITSSRCKHFDLVIKKPLPYDIIKSEDFLHPLIHIPPTRNLRVQMKSGSYHKKHKIIFYMGNFRNYHFESFGEFEEYIEEDFDPIKLLILSILLNKFDKKPVYRKFKNTQECIDYHLNDSHDLIFLATTFMKDNSFISDSLQLSDIENIEVKEDDINIIKEKGFTAFIKLSRNRSMKFRSTSGITYTNSSLEVIIHTDLNRI